MILILVVVSCALSWKSTIEGCRPEFIMVTALTSVATILLVVQEILNIWRS